MMPRTIRAIRSGPAIATLRRFMRDEAGATAIEYAGILTLIAVIILTAVTQLGSELKNFFAGLTAKFAAMGY